MYIYIYKLRILVTGAGLAGPTAAFWLTKAGHEVTIVERFSQLRAAGQQIDIRGPAVEVVKRMGLMETFKSKVVPERGLKFVDDRNRQFAFFGVNTDEKSFTTEYEIMRGDFCEILYQATKDSVTYIFNRTVESFTQDENSVQVRFSDGHEETFDMLIGADGIRSRTRKMMLGTDYSGPDPFRSLRFRVAYFSVPSHPDDGWEFTSYHTTQRRFVATRKNHPDTLQAYFSIVTDSAEADAIDRQPIDEQKKFWAKTFQDAGWQSQRLISGMLGSDEAKNFYHEHVGQVKMESWHQGRVVLVGDAASCPSPLSGSGTTCGIAGAYVLAGEIAKHCKHSSDMAAVDAAFKGYETAYRPFINIVQELPASPEFMFPKSHLGIWVLRFVLQVAAKFRIQAVIDLFSSHDGDWKLPYYGERESRQ
ncbi:hypothetical protein PFICI_00734 [Pestalotiopsis fici W106-1]|uniref:FAD-binding domain-containing protein n=1 Tax=Pestalotiopsis fici (strain W106-1 / CGMCC3.15140) TaxID=1229662 RepID=W3XNR5_PESFW|nr:uncharacterized protein PFICI_00734 [Pestalotiopsis fici W106-1]ETS86906.1 hypothetical protein PFICI_00734 [Pestalotiopsis fici W106-1]